MTAPDRPGERNRRSLAVKLIKRLTGRASARCPHVQVYVAQLMDLPGGNIARLRRPAVAELFLDREIPGLYVSADELIG